MDFVPHTTDEQKEMLDSLGFNSLEDLFKEIPEAVRFKGNLEIPGPLSEYEVLKHLQQLGNKNATSDGYLYFLGGGAYDHYIPAVVEEILSRSEFYTAYTPYQPEISQGILQVIFEYQSMICELTGMDIANASMYDGATALAESALLACAVTKRSKVLVGLNVHPEYREVLKTYTKPRGIKVEEIAFNTGVVCENSLQNHLDDNTACLIIQNPNFFGLIENGASLGEQVHAKGGLFIVSVDPISLGLLKSPGEYGADLVIGEGQSLGNNLNFGGPYLGIFAGKEKLMRRMPGRIVGMTKDRRGRDGFVLTLQAREQHIRREKATSNICSNQALNALAATVYMALMGKGGLKRLGELCLQKANYAFDKTLRIQGLELPFNKPMFKEFVIGTSLKAEDLMQKFAAQKIIGGLPLGRFYPELDNAFLWTVTEKRSKPEIDTYFDTLRTYI